MLKPVSLFINMYLRISLLMILIVALASPLFAQTGYTKGRVTDRQTGMPLQGVRISVDGMPAEEASDSEGNIIITVPAGEHLLYFDLSNYYQTIRQVVVIAGDTLDAGTVFMSIRPEIRQDAATIVVTDINDEGSSGAQGHQVILSSSADIFQSTAAYTFGPVRFRQRGYDQTYNAVMINGFLINDVETGNPLWSDWGGLNDVMRDAVVTDGPEATGNMFEPVGGLTSILTDASRYRPGVKTVYSLSNRTYTNRLMVTYSTGEIGKGWFLTGSASRRWGQQGYIQGTFYDGWSMFLSAEKKFNSAHSLNFTALDAIYSRGVAGGSVEEAYYLAGTNFYNPYWGYQNGKVRNSRVRSSNKPLMTLTHTWNIGGNTSLKTTAGYWFGKSGYTALNWSDAPDPRPDYYRYLPSYYTDSTDRRRIAALWPDPAVSQINWYHFYFTNSKNIEIIHDANGIEGNTVEGNRSKYVLEERRDDLSQFQFNTILSHRTAGNIKLSAGLMVNLSKGFNYNKVKDLLGGDFWLDIDQFAERDYPDDPLRIQNDLNMINRIVRTGDKYSHYYISHYNRESFWALGEWTPGRLRLYLKGEIGNT